VSRRLGLLLVVIATAAAAACGGGGGGDRLSKEEYIAQADAICKEANQKIDALGEPTLENFDQYIADAEKIARDQLAKLRSLSPPAEDETTLSHAYDLIEQQIDLALEGSEALKNQDQTKFQQVSSEIDKLNAEADQIAQDYGLQECGTSSS
jgi:hypothetical protein